MAPLLLLFDNALGMPTSAPFFSSLEDHLCPSMFVHARPLKIEQMMSGLKRSVWPLEREIVPPPHLQKATSAPLCVCPWQVVEDQEAKAKFKDKGLEREMGKRDFRRVPKTLHQRTIKIEKHLINLKRQRFLKQETQGNNIDTLLRLFLSVSSMDVRDVCF